MPSSKSASAWPLTTAARWKIDVVAVVTACASTAASAMSPARAVTRGSPNSGAATTSSRTRRSIGRWVPVSVRQRAALEQSPREALTEKTSAARDEYVHRRTSIGPVRLRPADRPCGLERPQLRRALVRRTGPRTAGCVGRITCLLFRAGARRGQASSTSPARPRSAREGGTRSRSTRRNRVRRAAGTRTRSSTRPRLVRGGRARWPPGYGPTWARWRRIRVATSPSATWRW